MVRIGELGSAFICSVSIGARVISVTARAVALRVAPPQTNNVCPVILGIGEIQRGASYVIRASQASKGPTLIDRFKALGKIVPSESRENFMKTIKFEAAVWRETIENAGIKLQ